MSYSIFADKEKPPAASEIFDVIGEKRPLWEELSHFVEANYRVSGESKFYGKSAGWIVWFRKSGRTLVALYPQKDRFLAQMVLGPSLWDKVSDLSLGTKTKTAFETANRYPDGRWLLLSVEGREDVNDIEKLLMIKQPLPRNRKGDVAPRK